MWDIFYNMYTCIMNKMKKILASLIWILIIFFINVSYGARWLSYPGAPQNPIEVPTPEISWEKIDVDPIPAGWHTLAWYLNWIIHIPQPSEYETTLWYVMKLIQVAINRVLWMLSFVALIYMLYCWFLVFSSWSGDKNAQKGKKWISTAAIALAWIGLSWLIVSAMIWFITIWSKPS